MKTREWQLPPQGAGLPIEDGFDLNDLSIRPPRLPSGSVMRRRLIHRLQAAGETDVVAVIAPAGYGKTTLLAQWVESEERPIAWLTLTRADNDESTLLSHLGMALASAGLIAADVSFSLRFGRPLSTSDGLSRIVWALADSQRQGALVIDQTEILRSRDTRGMVQDLIDHLDGRLRLVVASRSSTVIPMAKLRSQGRLLEIGEADLALDMGEARQLLERHDLELDLRAANLIERSEGWPVALSLLALAVETGVEPPAEARGDDRFLAEYFASEVLAKLSPGRRDFLSKTSILDRLTGGLCDAVLERDDSDKILRHIAEQTNLIHPIDRASVWYSMNGLLRDALRTELERQEPASLPDLNVRAAAWYEDHGMPAMAIPHAHMAGDTQRFTRTLGQLIRSEYVFGQASRVLQWMTWFEAEVPLADYPDITAVGALIHAIEGDGLETDRWWNAGAQASTEGGILPLTLLVRALGARHGVEAMILDAVEARETMAAGSFWIPAAFLVEGMAHLWNGDLDSADARLAEAVTLGHEAEAMLTISLGLAERASIAVARGEWDRADHLLSQSLRIIEDNGLENYSTSGLAYALGARVARHKGDLVHAKGLLINGSLSRSHLGTSIPGLAVQTLVEMARGCLGLADAVGARVLVRDAHDVVAQRPDLGELTAQLSEIDATLSHFGSGVAGPSALTKAELRLLPLLASHLTFPEIGDRLFISKHTVKSHAMSIYRKLGTSSRSEAVARAVESGLLQG
ncbi:MAG TPA: LuxR C-terminal-related transcriptional regulator [Acidimicrobiia bacterium]|nr:LuxR C-terminal-related transcriptional regulator [Acidimicrobiia bacterium]